VTDDIADKIDVSGVVADEQAYFQAYFAAALEGRSFGTCNVTWRERADPRIFFSIVFDDGSRSETLEVSSEVALVEDRSDGVVYDDNGARKRVLGFVEDGVLKGIVDSAFSRKAAG